MSYTVKILSSENFDKLPFERAKTSLGAADTKNRTAYIRDTGYNDITKGTISHELDELMQEKSPHEVDGIRYKDFSQSFSNFGSSIPAIGKVASPVLGAVGGGIDLLGQGASKIGLPSFNIGNPSVSQFSNQVKADKLASGSSWPGFGTGSGATSPGPMYGPKTQAQTNALPVFSTLAAMQPKMQTTQPSFFSKAADTVTNLFGKEGEKNTFQKVLPGAMTALAGGLFSPKASVPDFSGVRADLEGRIGGSAPGASEAYDLGFGEAKRIIDAPFGVVPQALFDEIDLRMEDEIRALEDRFRARQGGGGLSESDTSQFGRLRAQIVDQYDREKAALSFQYEQQQQANKIVTMQTLLDLDQAQFNQYAKLAELDVYELMMKTGVDVQTATEFKQLFSGVGEAMIQGALNPQTA